MTATISMKDKDGKLIYLGTTEDSIDDITANALGVTTKIAKMQRVVDNINAGKHASLHNCMAAIGVDKEGILVQCAQGFTVGLSYHLISTLSDIEIITNLRSQLDQWLNFDRVCSAKVATIIRQ